MLGPKFLRICYDLSPNLNAPMMVRMHLERGIASCATGYDRLVVTRAIGEGLERHLCYSDSDYGTKQTTLSELEPFIQKWFLRTLSSAQNNEDIAVHKFIMTQVREQLSGNIYLAPLVAFTLGICPDDVKYGFRDSSGTALHYTDEGAFLGSRDEYCERQALSLFWYYGHCLSFIRISPDTLWQFNVPHLRFMDHLLENGEVYLFDVSLISPVRTFVSVYLSEKGPVHFSAGAAGHEHIEKAVEKSLTEMYQAYILMQNISDSRFYQNQTIDDPIISGYASFNNPNVIKKFSYILNNQRIERRNINENIEFIKNFYEEELLIWNRKIIFSDPRMSLFYYNIKSVNGFTSMSLDRCNEFANEEAANYYGYSGQVNTGPIAFA
ncbi:YcaO-like family protein [Brenneria izadpanahii]|uniref:YcaO-like family protein n=1 Tax=Brenneria izadpanahii TaxID=2722756 RepID=A0ABX7UWG4_9GAMM|nr:YcaO-like family protein [Brenneria izadpanahii]QTF08942.1 YcaO-like family protein [Brenneria izadpanahii]